MRTIRWCRWAISLALVLVATVADARAQSYQGGLRGTVKDSGGVLQRVVVLLINERTDVMRETTTNGAGEYAFQAVEPGTYRLLAALTGYSSFERKGIIIGTQQFVALDVTLEIGTLEETITVVGATPLVDTTNASTGSVFDAKALESIPTAGRSVFLLANLEPTVQASGNAHWNRMQDQVGNSAVSMGGGAVRANNYLVDGFPVTDLQNRASTNPSIEAVQEMKVQVHTYDAEMGRTGGGVINMTAKTGTNDFHGSAYGVIRPEKFVGQLLIPKLQNQPNVVEYWRDNGGGLGGPIVRNKTFFWSAGETYVNNQPQQNSFLVPTSAERSGDFSGLTRNGAGVVIRDPLTGQPFAGNVVPANRINPVGQQIMNYLPKPTSEVDNGSPNFSMTDLLPNKAYQYTTKVDHHFNDAASVTAFWLNQITHEANSNYNPVNRFVGNSYQLDREIKTFVLNNQFVLGDSDVLTVRGGWNKFDDNYNLPYPFDATTLWPNNPGFTKQMSDTHRFPSTTSTGYFGTGFNPQRQANGYYQYGVNGTLSTLRGTHNLKTGGDFRILGVDSFNYGASTGSYTFTGAYSGNPMADMLLGYPQSGNIPLNTPVNGSVQYYSGYVQDDWRVSDRLTFNYGLRAERETGLAERNNQISVNFDRQAVNPLNSQVRVVDPVTGDTRQVLGGLVFAGVDGAPRVQGHQPAYKLAPRAGAVFTLDDKTVVRSGYGVFWSPWNYPAAGTTGWGQIGYSATTLLQQPQGVPTISLSDPFPNGLVTPTGNSRGLLTGTGGDIYFVDPDKGAPRVQQFSADVQRELPGNTNVSIGYTGARGEDLSWGGSNSGSTNGYININQIDPKYQGQVANTLALVPNPFYGVADAGQFANRQTIELGQLLRPFPQFGNVYMMQATGAHSLYHAAIAQLRKRATGLWGGQISYTFSRLNDNQIAESNYYSSNPGIQNNYTILPGSPYYNPNQEYGRSLLDSPHKLVIAPTLNVPAGEGLTGALAGGWSVTTVVTVQSGFPIGVTQNQTTTPFLFGGVLRPNLVPGQDLLAAGDITDRIRSNVSDNLYFNRSAFSAAPFNQFGNAPRMLPGVWSPWRNNVDLSVSKLVPTGGGTTVSARIEVLNLFNTIQWAAPASSALGNTSFGQIRNQANNMRMMQFTFRFLF
jgi:trimeric autotransporter adhesin